MKKMRPAEHYANNAASISKLRIFNQYDLFVHEYYSYTFVGFWNRTGFGNHNVLVNGGDDVDDCFLQVRNHITPKFLLCNYLSTQ